jgi:peptidoglycan/LPS O-acetylase OafA/YrhL
MEIRTILPRGEPVPARHSGGPKEARNVSLETLRDIAALSVVFWHSMLGFFPALSGTVADLKDQPSLVGSPIYGLINGPAAVALFFVLSGYVLTRKALITSNAAILARNAVKRWPRLAGPTTVATLLSWLGFELGTYHHVEVGAMTQSPWLSSFAAAGDKPFEPRFTEALLQGLYRTFFHGDFWYDSSLWTMKYEFIGSFVAFGLAAILIATPSRTFRVLLVLISLLLVVDLGNRWYAAFPLGVGLALLPEGRLVPGPMAAILFVLAVWLFGFTGDAAGIQLPLVYVFGKMQPVHVWTLAAACTILAAAGREPRPSSLLFRIGRLLGWISFPLYLIHVLVLCSAGTRIYEMLATSGRQAQAPFLAAAVTIIVSVIAAFPFAYANDAWNRWIERVLFKPAPQSRAKIA